MECTQASIQLMLQTGMFLIAMMGLGISVLNLLMGLWKLLTEQRQK